MKKMRAEYRGKIIYLGIDVHNRRLPLISH
jgi:hypothetical protein